MKKIIYYTYLGDRGTLTTQLFIPGAANVKKIFLVAEEGKKLTIDNVNFIDSVLIPESELALWKEV